MSQILFIDFHCELIDSLLPVGEELEFALKGPLRMRYVDLELTADDDIAISNSQSR